MLNPASLSPCPFCGRSKLYLDVDALEDGELHFVVCLTCGTEGPTGKDESIARNEWNKRLYGLVFDDHGFTASVPSESREVQSDNPPQKA